MVYPPAWIQLDFPFPDSGTTSPIIECLPVADIISWQWARCKCAGRDRVQRTQFLVCLTLSSFWVWMSSFRVYSRIFKISPEHRELRRTLKNFLELQKDPKTNSLNFFRSLAEFHLVFELHYLILEFLGVKSPKSTNTLETSGKLDAGTM